MLVLGLGSGGPLEFRLPRSFGPGLEGFGPWFGLSLLAWFGFWLWFSRSAHTKGQTSGGLLSLFSIEDHIVAERGWTSAGYLGFVLCREKPTLPQVGGRPLPDS